MADPAKNGPLSLGEKASLAFALLIAAPIRLVAFLVIYTLFALRHGYNVRFYLTCAGVRILFSSFSGRQIQALVPSTRQSYDSWMHRHGLVARVEALAVQGAPDAALLWIGDKQRATTVVLYFHGGGFVVPASQGHMELCWRAYVQPSQGRVAVALLEYSLSPGSKFPVQLRQAAAGLGAVLDAGFRAGNIVFGGDSAGGNMAMQLVSHVLHPVDAAARRLSLDEPVAGVFLVSPWVARSTESWSFAQNASNDMLTTSIVSQLGLEHFGPPTVNLAAIGPFTPQWLERLHHVTRRVYLAGGRREVFAAHLAELAQLLAKLDPALDLRVELPDQEAHDFILVEGLNRTTGPATTRMHDWLEPIVAAARP
ncbi:hypothetical protein CDD82_2133 [Ophiocordyceps australis]|uniref:Alpha/beta hydrolase fold-3 domain-containing protein n=1 Tax=Ophiocordyceps australis TaxID=1399860 RepID=A0A2C5Y2B8_9HYPO|nr:hypothetical protein CDD82_2133 [Ophiocordyceps australis]